jgi:hypothetical protein
MKLLNLRVYSLITTMVLLGGSVTILASEWRTIDLPSRPMNIAENNGTLWVSGADELIASSADGGKTWNVQHSVKSGGILLNIGFANEGFGYAAGTSGTLIVTADGGRTWTHAKTPASVVYAASFSDEKHGLVHTPRAIYTTSDGGETWTPVKIDFADEELERFSFVGTVLALTPERMAIVLSQGNGNIYHQKLFVTKDAGLNWKLIDIPSTGLRQLSGHGGEYWFTGMEVIEKDKPGGGYGVPLVMHSPDGESWTHLPRWSKNEFSECNLQGCLYWDGAGLQIPPVNPITYWTFPTEKAITAKWAVAKGEICSVAINLRCAAVATTLTLPVYDRSSSPIASQLYPPPLDAPPAQGMQCVACDVERVIVTKDFQGVAEADLRLHVAQNGLVEQIEVLHATTAEIGERLAASARNWIFVPYEKDGSPRPTITNVKLHVQAIKSK